MHDPNDPGESAGRGILAALSDASHTIHGIAGRLADMQRAEDARLINSGSGFR